MENYGFAEVEEVENVDINSTRGGVLGFGAPCTAEDLYKTNKSDTDLFDQLWDQSIHMLNG